MVIALLYDLIIPNLMLIRNFSRFNFYNIEYIQVKDCKQTYVKGIRKMTKNKKIDTFFELLCLNDSKQLNKFLMENGKGPKVICPIMFVDKKEFEENEEKEIEKYG